MRSLHTRPYSRLDNHVERVAEGLNSICLYGTLCSVFALLIICNKPTESGKAYKTRPAIEQKVSDISESKYTLAIAAGGSEGRKVKLTEAQIAEMDMWASKATNPDDVAKLKPKAKAAYYASLNRKSVWEAVP